MQQIADLFEEPIYLVGDLSSRVNNNKEIENILVKHG